MFSINRFCLFLSFWKTKALCFLSLFSVARFLVAWHYCASDINSYTSYLAPTLFSYWYLYVIITFALRALSPRVSSKVQYPILHSEQNAKQIYSIMLDSFIMNRAHNSSEGVNLNTIRLRDRNQGMSFLFYSVLSIFVQAEWGASMIKIRQMADILNALPVCVQSLSSSSLIITIIIVLDEIKTFTMTVNQISWMASTLGFFVAEWRVWKSKLFHHCFPASFHFDKTRWCYFSN